MVQTRQPLIFGEVLFDCFPSRERQLGGAPFNVAWHLQALGERPLFISQVGEDPLGEHIRHAMEDWGMDCRGLQRSRDYPTGQVVVSFSEGEPHYEITPDSAYDYIDQKALPESVEGVLVYHGSLALRNPTSRAALDRLLTGQGAPVFLDVNLRAPWWTPERVLKWLQRARWAKLNQDELALLSPQSGDLSQQMAALQQVCELDLLVVTCGAQGALARSQQGDSWQVQPEEAATIVDTVGAGDAFTAMLIHGMLQQWPMQRCLDAAQQFASAVVGMRGAIPQQLDFYRPFRSG